MTMPSAELTCEQVERNELDLKYLRGQLGPEESELFEAHFFECDQCWDLVRCGQELRSARPAPPVRRAGPRWAMLVAAVLVGAVGVGFWRTRVSPPVVPPAPLRTGSTAATLDVRSVSGPGLGAVWNVVPGAATYRVRLYTPDGGVAFERELADTFVVLPGDSARTAGLHFWQVMALDRLGGELARSGLVDATATPPPGPP